MPTITVEPYKILQRRDGINYPLNNPSFPALYDLLANGGSPPNEAFTGYRTEASQIPRRATASLFYDLPIPAGAYIVSAKFSTHTQIQPTTPYKSLLSARRFDDSDGDPDGTPVIYTGAQPNWLFSNGAYMTDASHVYVSPATSLCTAYDESQTRDVIQQVIFRNNWASGDRLELHLDGEFLSTPGQLLVTGLVVVDAALEIEYIEQPAVLMGGAFRELLADVQFGETFRQVWGMVARGDAEFASTTREGRIVPVRADIQLGTQFVGQRKQRIYGAGQFGDRTTDKLRHIVQLRLKAGKVASDVGYMWIPVYLQLPDDPLVADFPWEFFYIDGTPIPHLIRQEVDRQVRALVYMRPSVAVAQGFYARVG